MPDSSPSPVTLEALQPHISATLAEQPAFRSFLKQAIDQLGPDDLDGIRPETLAGALVSYWEWAGEAAPRSARLRPLDLTDPASEPARMLLETTGSDRPFLIDSLQGELAAQGVDLFAALHPIVASEHGANSHIQFHLPPLLPEEADRLMKGVRQTLDDVETATGDYQAMRQRMRDEAQKLATMEIFEPAVRDEAYAFLSWLAEDHFVFLGSRSYRFRRDASGEFLPDEPDMVEGSNLGLLRDESRNVLNAGEEPTVLTPEIGAFLNERSPVFVAKSSLASRVHRRVLCDYIGVKQYDAHGRVVGETRFAGLFTSEAYTRPTADVPLIRRKVTNVMARSQTVPGSHNAKALRIILENHPRDELFQIGEDELLRTSLAILNLQSRPRPALFIRRDRFDRFVSALLYVPREAYNADMRRRIGEHVARAYGGEVTAFYPRFGDDMLARVLYTVTLKPGHPEPDPARLKSEIVSLARSWQDRFRAALDADGTLTGQALQAAACFRNAFNAAYREAFSPGEAIADVREISELAAHARVRVRTYRRKADPDTVIRAKVYARGESIALSRCVPVMENLGFFVDFETGYPVRPVDLPIEDAPDTYWVHDFNMRSGTGGGIDMHEVGDALEDAFVAVWTGRAENDAFNRLIPAIGADWHEAALFRTLARYRRQSGLDPFEDVQVQALVTHRDVTRKLLELFETRFDPAREMSLAERAEACAGLSEEISAMLRDVSSLDEDRVLHRFRDLILASQRTNFYQKDAQGRPKSVISLKIASREIENLPEPKPFREIFLASPEVEGVHLRFGKVARGGLRWSDRRDDFRTEVLGLVKAQQVKNAVIVPVGSKGGFYPKQLPASGSREEVFEAGRAAYKSYIRALLEITDNVREGETTHPGDTVIWDGEDPYLVVAADKGTATFSDTANEISLEMGHWLGDAFASGGSAGYDHKKMGITARGAWEAVKRHFREMGTDIQSEPFTVIGVGDMSGDVFGNGMLLSEQTKLIAAFNHLHIFIDPDPDPASSFKERKRLFEMDRSSWEDYSQELISEGGGIFRRSAKSIDLTDAIRDLTGLEGNTTTPDELIAALVKAPCDLLWFGGIGTYVKCSTESHSTVGDKANDAIRADARDLKARVIGEGANLGITQAGRIEFAMKGGRINTDAIDNSAGVDSSDHEVNIKILLKAAIDNGALAEEDRNALLADMTDQVAAHVLAHNYSQTRALTLAEHEAEPDHEALERLMVSLENRGVLNRKVEGLPRSAQMAARADSGLWLTRPELSVLFAWSKIVLFDDIVDSDVPDDPFHAETLKQYFPDRLDAYDSARADHRLKREIIATVLANRLLDRLGPGMTKRLVEASGAEPADLVTGFTLAEELLRTSDLEAEIAALDNCVPAEQQTLMRLELANGLFNLTARFANDFGAAPIGDTLERLKPAFEKFRDDPLLLATPFSLSRKEERIEAFKSGGVPEDLAQRVMAMRPLIQGPLVIKLADECGRDIEASAQVFTSAGEALSLDRLRVIASEALADMPFWDRVATRRFIADMMAQQVRLAKAAIHARGETEDPVRAWLADREADRRALIAAIDAKAEDGWSYAKFAIAADDIRRFMEANGTGGI